MLWPGAGVTANNNNDYLWNAYFGACTISHADALLTAAHHV